MPKLSRLDTKNNTGEPDGVEVKLPIHLTDIDNMVVTAERVYRYFKVPPKISGAKVEFRRTKPSQQGTEWRYIGDGKSYALMGNVGYDISIDSLGDKLNYKAKILLQLGVELDFKIGELEIAANREGLQYRDITKQALMTKLAFILTEVGSLFSKQIAGATNMWEAKKLYYELFQQRGDYGQRTLRECVDDKVIWNGKPVTTGKYEFLGYDPYNTSTTRGVLGRVCIHRPYQSMYGSRRSKGRRDKNWFDWFAKDTHHIIINDLPGGHQSPTREAGFWATNPTVEKVLLLTFESDAEKDKWWKKWELDGHPFTLMSAITPLKAPVTAGSSSGPSAHKNKHQAAAFILKNQISDRNTASLNWDIATVDTAAGKGAYVSLQRFNVMNSKWENGIVSFIEMITLLRGAGLLKNYPKIYGFKQQWLDKHKTKLGAGWEKLENIITVEMDTFTKGKEQDYANLLESQKHLDFVIAKDWAAVPQGNSLREYIDALSTMKQCSHAQIFDCLRRGVYKNWIGDAPNNLPKPTVKLDKLLAEMNDDFPMLKLWGSVSYYRKDLKQATKSEIKLAIDYVNMVLSV